jgi:S-(hydroxymethyl)glutathione dehydrogenase/alcohol dehydrogenase
MKSRSLVLREPGVAPVLEDVEVLDPGPGEVMVRMVASGVCGTDLHAVTGEQPIPRFPVILGHEGAGVVEMVGPSVVGLTPGDHVVVALYADCAECAQCIRGRPDECDSEWRRVGFTGLQMDGRSRVRQGDTDIHPMFGVGTLAEYTTIRAAQAIRIDPDLSLEAMCLTACGVATGMGAVLHNADVSVGDSVLVVGCGGVGLNVVQGARIAGAGTIIAADISDHKLALARELGATHLINTSRSPLEVHDIVPAGVDVAFEVVGDPELIAVCVGLTRVGGTCVLVGLTPPGATIPVDGRLLGAARRIVGCRSGGGAPKYNIPLMAGLYRQGRLKLDELIGQRLSLDDAAVAFGSADVVGARTVVTIG